MREFDFTNNNCLWILKTYEAHKKELLKKTKEVENPMIIRDDIVKWNWIGKGKSELKDITELLHIEVCFDQRQNTHRYIYLG